MADEQTTQTNDQVSQEDYQALKAELEAEKASSQEAVADATQELTGRVAALEADLQARDSEIGELKTAAEGQTQELTILHKVKDELESAVGAYKDVVLKANPLVPTDMLQGLTIDEVNASLEKATGIVGQIKQGLEAQQQAQTQTQTVPAGAPVRTGPDVSSMTTKEKINYGLEQARKKE